MATGDQADMLERLKRVLPRGWFSDNSPVLDGVLSGFAHAAAHCYSLLLYAKAQTRIRTASDGWLDLIAFDFFGLRFQRRKGEADSSFSSRIIAEILRPRNTRASIIASVQEVTGRPNWLFFEPWNPTDTGGYGITGRMGYGMAGRYGSLMLPNQAFIIPLRPLGQGIPNVQGYQLNAGERAIGGYAQGAIEYGNDFLITGRVTDADIYQAIEAVRPAGCIIWTNIRTSQPEYRLDVDFVLDSSTLAQ